MKLMVPANYDQEIVGYLGQNSVSEIYGKLPEDVVGGGRPSYMAGPLKKRRLEQYIKAVQGAGMEFNYLLNTACLGNREWTPQFHKRLRKLLDWLAETGVKKLTLAIPYLAQIITKEYPQFKFKTGIYAQVDTVKRAQYWQDLGAEGIVLESFSINRNFPLLEKIRAAVSCDLTLIANHFCQPNCPYQVQHQNGHAHASGEDCRFFLDFPLLECQMARITEPRLMIASPWIRPEDIRHYEALGYTSFKLLERDIPSKNLVERVTAYHRRQFKGNFADLIFSWGFDQQAPNFSWLYFLKKFQPWKLKGKTQTAIKDFLGSQGMFFPLKDGRPPIEIRSDKIPDQFLEWFRNKDCSNLDCKTCGFCERVARQTVEIDPAFQADSLRQYQDLKATLLSGKF